MKFSTKVKAIRNSMELTHGIRRALMNALALIYFISLGFSVVWVTTLFSVSTLIMIFFEFPTGAIADYDSRKKSLAISFLLMSVSFFGIFFFNSFWILAVFWILGDIAWTFGTGAGSAWAIDALDAVKDKSVLLSLAVQGSFSNKLGKIVGGLLGFFIVAISFRYIWLAISLSNLFMFFVVLIYMEEKNFSPEAIPKNYLSKVLLKARESFFHVLHEDNSKLRVLMGGHFLGTMAFSSFLLVLPLFLIRVLHFEESLVPLIFSIFSIFSLFASLVSGHLVLKKGFRLALFYIWFSIGLALVLVGLINTLIISLALLAILHITGTMEGIIGDSVRQFEFSPKIRASLGSIISINWAIANAIAVFLSGLGISIFGIKMVLICAGILAFITSLIYLVGTRD